MTEEQESGAPRGSCCSVSRSDPVVAGARGGLPRKGRAGRDVKLAVEDVDLAATGGDTRVAAIREVSDAAHFDQEKLPRHDSVLLSGGVFSRGDAFREGYPFDGELPVREVFVSPFSIDRAPVTVAQFAAFVNATGYVTEAERDGYSAVFHLAVNAPSVAILGTAPATPWWVFVTGAEWRFPSGRGEGAVNFLELLTHPVTHVTHRDAVSYCLWAGRRLPTETEWEYAARGGLVGARYAWGDELTPGGAQSCNIWQGVFPDHNTALDGYVTTSPVGTYRPNGFGLVDVAGNVWEWCADWFSVDAYRSRESRDPLGPVRGDRRIIRGGSYLCHESYCNRYRVAARSHADPSSPSGNIGFRTVAL
ncbi:formylglycine-generating enzyme family protein [Lysinibacter sp. HNR]|uniref:formylglycine-generating enzyme family protein n=1 Tax=Lysinibacter sp. HNR TaxID=3031408 RepID=UPI0024350099|nr:formylglycine-generating enzyme family protein [Lysinibacter sp. HNR]WGD37319.1 formylglycine-generating enzyme family protein [Lysinibacter sp. HNR]